jgi:hypothetical protein
MISAELKKEIENEFKAAGIELAEEGAIKVANVIFKMLPKIASETDNKIDDMLVPLLGLVQPQVIELLKKIDGK